MATATTTSNPNGVNTATNTGLVYQGANGNTFNNYSFNTISQYGTTVNERVYTDPFGRVQAEYYDSNGRLVNQIGAASQDEFNTLRNQYTSNTSTVATTNSNKRTVWNTNNLNSVTNYSPVQGLTQEQLQQRQTSNVSPQQTAQNQLDSYLKALNEQQQLNINATKERDAVQFGFLNEQTDKRFSQTMEFEKYRDQLAKENLLLTDQLASAREDKNFQNLTAAQREQRDWQTQMNDKNNEFALNMLNANTDAQSRLGQEASQQALASLNAAFGNQMALMERGYAEANNQGDKAFQRTKELNEINRGYALEDFQRASAEEERISTRNRQWSIEDRDREFAKRQEIESGNRQKAFDAYAIGSTVGAGSGGSRAIQRYDGRGTIA